MAFAIPQQAHPPNTGHSQADHGPLEPPAEPRPAAELARAAWQDLAEAATTAGSRNSTSTDTILRAAKVRGLIPISSTSPTAAPWDGALSGKTKQLIAVAVAHVTQCPYCIKGHTKAALRDGATPEELMEAIWVAAEMRAGGAYAHSVLALETVDEASGR